MNMIMDIPRKITGFFKSVLHLVGFALLVFLGYQLFVWVGDNPGTMQNASATTNGVLANVVDAANSIKVFITNIELPF